MIILIFYINTNEIPGERLQKIIYMMINRTLHGCLEIHVNT